MNSRALVVVLGIFLAMELAPADPAPTPPPLVNFADLVKKNGTVIITDGSSLFTFSKDGTFSQEPVEISGRTVTGKWTQGDGDYSFVITGNWGWENGASPVSDPRRMVMAIYPGGKFGTIKRLGEQLIVYQGYFEIEELVKMPAGGKP